MIFILDCFFISEVRDWFNHTDRFGSASGWKFASWMGVSRLLLHITFFAIVSAAVKATDNLSTLAT